MWTRPAAWTDVGDLMLLVFTANSVPTWEIHSKANEGAGGGSLIISGTADTFEAATRVTRHNRSITLLFPMGK